MHTHTHTHTHARVHSEKSGMIEMEGEVVAKQLYSEEKMTSLLSTTADVLGKIKIKELHFTYY